MGSLNLYKMKSHTHTLYIYLESRLEISKIRINKMPSEFGKEYILTQFRTLLFEYRVRTAF